MSKFLRVSMPDGTVWDVPAEVVAEDRSMYYAKKENGVDTYKEEYEFVMSKDGEDELMDWAKNNMNWEDVQPFAIKLKDRYTEEELEKLYQEGWMNGDMDVI